ncbi:MAG TPA: 4-hydroxy-3-methylbut-2-enyl diphosphate reductase [Gemmatimonadales bacterium]|nr:4-hydroxy-3-methylbut-2-enyl diphosphate reductase [Gemmatimonadales bacterium]
MADTTYFRRGFGLKSAIEGQLSADYHSGIVDALRAGDFRLHAGPLTFRLAREFGFCYGVDRAVDYAYESRAKFPDKRIFLVGEIIHNPHVNAKLRAMGIEILAHDPERDFDFSAITPGDVVILPAFGVTVRDFERLRALGCVLVDTTCGSVLNVWKRVESYARDGFTAVIHGKHWHEETKATASQANRHPGGKYLVVLDMAEARPVLDFIERGGDAGALEERFRKAISPGFDFSTDLRKVGIANQTTMLSGESLAIAAEFGRSMARRYGEEHLAEHFRSFDTICSATQERQDAIRELLREPPDVMLVIGGYNSSNTCHLAELSESLGVRTYHIEDADCIDPVAGTIRYQPVGAKGERTDAAWLGAARDFGITAGASTPNNKIGETVAAVAASAGAADALAATIRGG